MFHTTKKPVRVTSRAARILVVAVLLVWWAVCWLLTGAWFEHQTQESYRTERLRANDFVAQASTSLDRIVRLGSGGPRLLSRSAHIQRVLAHFAASPMSPQTSEAERRVRWTADPELKRINSEFKTAANDLGLDVLVLLDVNGYCLAASNADSAQSIVGAYFGDHENFRSARLGHPGYLASANKQKGSAGLTYYTPVMVQERFAGVVSGGNALAPFVNVFDQADAFLSDLNGAVLLAQAPSIALPPDLAPWGDPRFSELLRVPGRDTPVLLRSHSAADDGLNVSVLWPVPQLVTLVRQRWMVAGALGVPCTLLMLLAVVYVSQRREQRAIRLALTERERRVTHARIFLEQIVDSITEPLFVKDQACRWIMVNKAFCKIHGLPRETFIGKLASDVFPADIAQRVREADERVLTAGIEYTVEEKLVDSRGTTHIVVTKKAPYTDASGLRFIVGVISDISERKQVERLMRAKEREFRSLAENLPDNVARWDAQGRYIYTNPTAERSIGAHSDEVFAKRLGEAFPDGRFRPLETALNEVIATGRPMMLVRQPVPTEDGEVRHHEISLAPEFDDAGHVVSVLGIGRDMTDIRRLQDALVAREKAFRALAENLPDPVFRYDRDCRRVYVNPAAMRITTMSTEQLLGHLPVNCVTITPDDADRLLTAIRTVFATGERSSHNIGYINSDGSVSDYQGLLVPEFDANGQVATVLAMAHDVTSMRRAERYAASFFANMPGFAYTLRTSPDGRTSLPFASSGIESIYGLHPEEVREDASLLHALEHPDDQSLIEAAGAQAAQTLLPFQVEFRVLRPGHPERWIESRSVPQRQADGGLLWHGVMLDITERKRMEAEINARAQEFKTLVEHAPEPIFRYAPDGRHIYVNAAVERITGTPAALLVGGASSDGEIISAHDRAAVVALVRRICETGEPGELEVEHVDAHGQRRHFHNRFAPELGANGEVKSVFSICHDITDRKRTEQRLKEALEFSDGIINAIPDILFEVDCEGRYLNVWTQDPNVLRATQKSELLGKTIYEVLSPDSAATSMQAIAEADVKGSSFSKAICIEQSDGGLRWYEHSIARKLGRAPSEATFLVLSRDVTKNIEAQQRLDETSKRLLSVLKTMPDMVWLKDAEGVYQLNNHAFSRLTGMDESHIFGRTDYDLFDTELADFFREQDLKAIEAGTIRLNEEWVNYADDGHRALLETRKVPVYGAGGKLTGVLGIARDITERKEAELALRASEAHIQSRNELLQAIVESSPEINIFALDTTYRYLAFNRKHRVTMQAIWGNDISIGMSMLDVIGDHPDGLVAQTSMARALAGESFVLEETYGSELLSRQHWLNHWAPIRSETGEVVGLTCFALNISERRTAEERLRRSRDIVRALAAHQETEHEKERRRLAYEIHEDLAQNFAALRLHLASLEMGDVDAQHAQVLKTMHGIADHSIVRIRGMVSMLRPAVLDLGLVSALQWLTDDFKGVGLDFVLTLQDDIVLSDALTTFLYRAAKEALLNVALHAAATQVHVSLAADAGICRLVVRDNGCGFDSVTQCREGRFGLIGLAEGALHLGGELFVDSTPGRGTTLEIRTPIPNFSST